MATNNNNYYIFCDIAEDKKSGFYAEIGYNARLCKGLVGQYLRARAHTMINLALNDGNYKGLIEFGQVHAGFVQVKITIG